MRHRQQRGTGFFEQWWRAAVIVTVGLIILTACVPDSHAARAPRRGVTGNTDTRGLIACTESSSAILCTTGSRDEALAGIVVSHRDSSGRGPVVFLVTSEASQACEIPGALISDEDAFLATGQSEKFEFPDAAGAMPVDGCVQILIHDCQLEGDLAVPVTCAELLEARPAN